MSTGHAITPKRARRNDDPTAGSTSDRAPLASGVDERRCCRDRLSSVPELPEVETIRRQLEGELIGRRIDDAWAFPHPKFDQAHDAVGGRFTALRRRGKYLIAGLSGVNDRRAAEPTAPDDEGGEPADVELVVHLGMTGRLGVVEAAPPEDAAHRRASWTLDDGRVLQFVDVRRFGRIAVVDAGDHESLATLHRIGPEPFDDDFDPEALRRAVNASRRAVKTQLLAQRVVAGVGNIYADEALWLAGVHPASRRLTRAGAIRLRDAVRAVLQAGIDHGGTTLRDYRDARGETGSNQHQLACYGRSGSPCGRCGTTLRRTVIDARTTTFCPVCQRR